MDPTPTPTSIVIVEPSPDFYASLIDSTFILHLGLGIIIFALGFITVNNLFRR